MGGRTGDKHAYAGNGSDYERSPGPGYQFFRQGGDSVAVSSQSEQAQVHHQDGADDEGCRNHVNGFEKWKPRGTTNLPGEGPVFAIDP